METILHKHIIDMKKFQQMVLSKSIDKDLEETIAESIEACIENAESFLKSEKEQVIKAWESGYSNGVRSVSRGEPKIKSAEEYYTKQY